MPACTEISAILKELTLLIGAVFTPSTSRVCPLNASDK